MQNVLLECEGSTVGRKCESLFMFFFFSPTQLLEYIHVHVFIVNYMYGIIAINVTAYNLKEVWFVYRVCCRRCGLCMDSFAGGVICAKKLLWQYFQILCSFSILVCSCNISTFLIMK